MHDSLHIEVETRPQAVVARLGGSAANEQAAALHDALAGLLDRRADPIVLDLRELEYIASMALAELIQFRRDLQTYGGRLRLAGARENIAEVFRQTRLMEIFPMFDDPDAAMQSQ